MLKSVLNRVESKIFGPSKYISTGKRNWKLCSRRYR